jgi:hypothetical protein
MSTTIDQSFVKQFESDVHLAYQRMGSKLRNTIRTKTDVKGKSTTFQTVGAGVAGEKARHGQVPIMNLVHAPVECLLKDHYAGEYIDELDELKVNHDEKMVAAESGAAAVGRKSDDIILDALDATTNPNNVAVAQIWSTAAGPIAFMEAMGAADVPVGDGNLFHVVCWQAWGDLIQIDEFSNADYVGENDLPFKGIQAKQWLGMTWFPHSGLRKDANGDFKQFVYHRRAAGHAIGKDLSADITWQGKEQAHLSVYKMSQGAVLIDSLGVIENVYDVTP